MVVLHVDRVPHGRPPSSALTLVELLVCVVILAILAVLVGEGSSSYRERVRAVKCMANLRGLGNALQIYAAESESRLPSLTPDNVEIGVPQGARGGMDIRFVLVQYDSALWSLVCPSDPRTKACPDSANPWYVSYLYLQEGGLDLGQVTGTVTVMRDSGFFHGRPGRWKSSMLFSDQHLEMESR